MDEIIRSVVVTIEVATNKQTRKKRLTRDSNETREEFERRIAEALGELMELE